MGGNIFPRESVADDRILIHYSVYQGKEAVIYGRLAAARSKPVLALDYLHVRAR